MTTLVSRLNAGDQFDSLKGEEEQPRNRRAELDGTVASLVEAFDKVLRVKDTLPTSRHPENLYDICLKNMPKGYTSRNISELIRFLALRTINDDKPARDALENLGLFVSALINESAEKEHRIMIPQKYNFHNGNYFDGLSFIGYRNDGKHIIIEGEGELIGGNGLEMKRGILSYSPDRYILGSATFGESMEGGRIELKYSGESRKGYHPWHVGNKMKGGQIIVQGDVGDVAYDMIGGLIRITGNVQGQVGLGMKGGEVCINGDCNSLVGQCLDGGLIQVEGNVFYTPGRKMQKGEIHVNNSKRFGLPRSAKGGNIYRDGRLVLRDGGLVK